MYETDVLECRKYMAENEMFEAAGRLSTDLHDLEHELASLNQSVHELVCERGRMPIETKTFEILDQLFRMVVAVDTEKMRTAANEIASLKARIDAVDRELEEIRATGHPQAVTTAA